MDKEGWLPISLIASFHRIQALTQDIELIIQVNIQTQECYENICERMNMSDNYVLFDLGCEREPGSCDIR